MVEKIEDYVYTTMWPTPVMDGGYTTSCWHKTWGGSMGPYKCSRGATHIIQGYGFCTQHAKMLKALGLWEEEG